MMTSKDRILEFLNYLGLGQNAFEKKVGISNGYISHLKKSFGAEIISKISSIYPELDTHWLLTGEGKMLKSPNVGDTSAQSSGEVLLLPISAQGGSLNDFVVSVKGSDCERIISPIRDVDFAMSVAGDSMSPEYPSGSQILIKKINEKAFIDWGRVYVLDTCNGTVIKKLMPPTANEKECVRCVSINPEYPSFEVNLSDVYGVYKVLLCMSIK